MDREEFFTAICRRSSMALAAHLMGAVKEEQMFLFGIARLLFAKKITPVSDAKLSALLDAFFAKHSDANGCIIVASTSDEPSLPDDGFAFTYRASTGVTLKPYFFISEKTLEALTDEDIGPQE
jgi:hypothetical protein